jgi:carbon storage regulator
MLVLTRKIGERIVIGDNVEVEVTRLAGGKVSLGITAPLSMPIRRGELDRLADPKPPNPAAPAGTPCPVVPLTR